jgi:hypothetical protein
VVQELIGVTDSEHKEFERLNSALEKIRQVVSRVNDSKKAEEEMEAMAKVVERLQGVEVRIPAASSRFHHYIRVQSSHAADIKLFLSSWSSSRS